MLEFNRLITYGCSHMAALESADENYYVDAEEIKRKHGYPYFRKLLQQNKNFVLEDYIEENKKQSWPLLLSKKLNVPCLNRANPGASIYKIIWDFESDVSSGILSNNDLILIDLVSPYRLIDFSNEKTVDTLNLNRPSFWKDYLQEGAPFFSKVFNNDFLIFYYIIAVKYLISYKKSHQIYFTIPHNENIFFLKSKNYKVLCDMHLRSFSEIDIITYYTLLNNCVTDRKKDRYYEIGHAKPIEHQRYAEKLYQTIVCKLN